MRVACVLPMLAAAGLACESSRTYVLYPDPGPADAPAEAGGPCIQGEPCDDGDPCTHGERCAAGGTCEGGTPYACDDGRPCTVDRCDGRGFCEVELASGACLIDGLCREAGTTDPDNPCLTCDPAGSPTSWSPAPDGTACEPLGLPPCETAAGSCVTGICEPGEYFPRSCDDGLPCTLDSCDPEEGCRHLSLSGTPCTGADPCRPGACDEGTCVVPPAASCDDGDPCTTDSCEASGCRHQPATGIPCDDHDACTIEDACVAGACFGVARNCDDGNACTKDGCAEGSGCFHEVDEGAPCCDGGISWCDDGSPCTTDTCDPLTFECGSSPNAAACDDGNPCTVNDSCAAGACEGVPMSCNDGNPCTTDICLAGECKNTPIATGPCDDGLDCSTGDHCVDGGCVADKTGCGCDPKFSDTVNKVVRMWIAPGGHPGDGLDVDGDVATCTPATNCSAGVDNALGPLGAFGGDSLQVGLDAGRVVLLYEHRGLKTDGTPYPLGLYAGRLASSNSGCDLQHDECAYEVNGENLSLDCEPLAVLPNAKVIGNKLTAGGLGGTVPFDMPLFGGVTLHVDMLSPRLEATLEVSGGKVVSMTGILAGGVPLAQLKQGILNAPAQFWPPELPPPEEVAKLVDVLVKPDIDGNHDGKPESASIGVHFEAIAGRIVGVF